MSLYGFLLDVLDNIQQPAHHDKRPGRANDVTEDDQAERNRLALRVEALEHQQDAQEKTNASWQQQQLGFERSRRNRETLGLIVLIAYTSLTFWLARTASQGTEIARHSLTDIQRAIISPTLASTGTMNSIDRITGKIIATQLPVIWSNNGSTPARDVVTSVMVKDYGREILPTDFDFSPTDPSFTRFSFAMGPHEQRSTLINVPMMMTERLGRGGRTYIWGWVTYKDIFQGDPIRLSEFCVELISPQAIFSGDPSKAITDFHDPRATMSITARQCGRYSCYDEDCQDYAKRTKDLP